MFLPDGLAGGDFHQQGMAAQVIAFSEEKSSFKSLSKTALRLFTVKRFPRWSLIPAVLIQGQKGERLTAS